MTLQTGGRSLGATSTKSMPASRATSRALLVGMTPSIAPSALMTRTGEMRICSLTLKPRSIGPMTSSSGTRTREPSPKRDASARLGAAIRTRTMPRLTPSVSRSAAARQPRDLLPRTRTVKVLGHDPQGAFLPAYLSFQVFLGTLPERRQDLLQVLWSCNDFWWVDLIHPAVCRMTRSGCPARTMFVERDLSESSGSAVDATRRAGYQWPDRLGPCMSRNV